MPIRYLNCDFLSALMEGTKPSKTVRYADADIPGFQLDFRPSGAGTWYFRYRNSVGRLGARRLGSLKELNASEARFQAYALYKQMQQGVPLPSSLPPAGTVFREFALGVYMPHAKLRKRSWLRDERMLQSWILPVFGARGMDGLQSVDIVNWQSRLADRGLSPASCNRLLALLKRIFSCAVAWGWLPAAGNPSSGVKALAERRRQERFLTSGEARRLLAALDTFPLRQAACAIKLLLFTGARKNEILRARWENVDWEHRLLTVPLSKSGKARHIPLSDEALAILQELPRRGDWLFPGKRGTAPSSDIFYAWKRIREDVRLPGVRLHDLRHSFASFLVNSGCSLYEVQQILGHSDPRVTMRYAHLETESLRRAAGMVGKAVCVRKVQPAMKGKERIFPLSTQEMRRVCAPAHSLEGRE